MKKSSITLQQAYEQMAADRKLILESYQKFSEQVNTLNEYTMNGQNINKCLELLTKQTAQLLELAKIQSASTKYEIDLSEDDHQAIYKELKDAKRVVNGR